MKISVVFIAGVLLVIVLCDSTFAQQAPPLERTLSITFSNERVISILKALEQQGRFTFSYNPAVLDGEKRVSHTFSNSSIREILNTLFSGSLQYKERGNYIILTRAPKPPAKTSVERSFIISGYVVNANTGEKLSRVSVYEKESLTSAITSSFGYFTLRLSAGQHGHTIAFNKRSFRDTAMTITAGRNQVITMVMVPEEKIIVDRLKESDLTPDSIEIPGDIIVPLERSSARESQINMENIRDTLFNKVQVSLLPFVGTNHVLSGNVVSDYSFNVLGGYSFGVNRFEIGSIFNVVRGDVQHVQLAGVFNAVGGNVKGLQAAGVFNLNRGTVEGTQLGGALNVNLSHVKGPQFAGVLNVNGRASSGAQFAGAGNVQVMDYKGSQVAGVFNIATHHVRGLQLAGVLNFGRTVQGVQIGVINISDSIHGVPIGWMSLVRKGYHKIELSADEIFYTNIAFRTGVHQFYNIFTAGIKSGDFGDPIWSLGYGIGTAPRLSSRLYLNIDLISSHVSHGHLNESLSQLNKVYLGFDYQIRKKISVTGGVTLNGYLTRRDETFVDIFRGYRPHFIRDEDIGDSSHIRMWWGGKIGIRFL